MIFFIILIVLAIVLVSTCVKIVPQAHAFVIERLGVYKETWSVGLHFKIPFLDRVSRKVNLKEQVADFEPQPVITRDNVTMQIDTIIFYQITDPKLYAYGVENPIVAIKSLTATTLRNIVGDLELDETLTSRETINAKMRTELDVATDPWGIKVNRVELKNIIPPRDIQEAMEKQMRAEREKREQILRAEGEKKSAVLIAEGKKEAAILRPTQKRRRESLKLKVRHRLFLVSRKLQQTVSKPLRKQELMRQFLHLRVLKLLQQQQTVRLQRLLFHLKFRELPVQ